MTSSPFKPFQHTYHKINPKLIIQRFLLVEMKISNSFYMDLNHLLRMCFIDNEWMF